MCKLKGKKRKRTTEKVGSASSSSSSSEYSSDTVSASESSVKWTSGWSSSQLTSASTPDVWAQLRSRCTFKSFYVFNETICSMTLYLGHQRYCLWYQTETSRQTLCFSLGSPFPSAGGRWVREAQGRSSASSAWGVWHAVWWQVWWSHWSCSPQTAERTGGPTPRPGTDTQPELLPTHTGTSRDQTECSAPSLLLTSWL